MNFRSLNCETNTRQLYGLLTGTGSASPSMKNVGRPWSNTATLAPKRVTNKVQPISINQLNNQNNQNTNQLNSLLNNSTTTNNLVNIQMNGHANLSNSLNNQANQRNLNSNKTANNQTNKGQQTLPTIYESNHYKETDLQPLFNSFTSQDDKPPVPPISSSCYSNGNNNKLNSTTSFNNITTSNYHHHHQPSAVLKQLPSNNEETELNDNAQENKNNSSNDIKETNKPSNKLSNEQDKLETKQDSKNLKIDNLQSKFEEEITIYQRPVPLPGRLMKSSSLEDLFKIKVCKLNPLNGDLFDQSKTIIFCANPGPLSKIKTNKSISIESPAHKLDNSKIDAKIDAKLEDKIDDKLNNLDNNEQKDEKQLNGDNLSANKLDDNEIGHLNRSINNLDDSNAIDENNLINEIGEEEEDKNSLNTAIAASFKGFLGDLQACKQNQLALTTFRPLANGTQKQSTGITGQLNTSSTVLPINQISIKSADPSIEQISTMANPFTFTSSRKQPITQSNSQINQLDEQLQLTKSESPAAADITDLLKEFDVCFNDENANECNLDLISFPNESNKNSDQLNLDLVHFPLPPPSLFSNSSINVCPSSSACLNTNNLNNNNLTTSNLKQPINEQQSSNCIKPSNCSSSESLQYESSSLARLLDQTALKQASVGRLETSGSNGKIQFTELDLSMYFIFIYNIWR